MIDLRTTQERYGDVVIAEGLQDQAEELMVEANLRYKAALYNLGGTVAALGCEFLSKIFGEKWPTESYDFLSISGVFGFIALGHLSEASGPHLAAWRKNRLAKKVLAKAESPQE